MASTFNARYQVKSIFFGAIVKISAKVISLCIHSCHTFGLSHEMKRKIQIKCLSEYFEKTLINHNPHRSLLYVKYCAKLSKMLKIIALTPKSLEKVPVELAINTRWLHCGFANKNKSKISEGKRKQVSTTPPDCHQTQSSPRDINSSLLSDAKSLINSVKNEDGIWTRS